ncbi:DUF6924 domain-containing protein [Nocardiopsis flavescens]|uniref:DUF6924 domain-containing protein n=2 Tax=Nocardiopsis flavescens TaxID=758803 RepID=UPI0036DB702C
MARPSLPLPPLPPEADDAPEVSGILLLRTGGDDATWKDVLHRLGDPPGLRTPAPDGDRPALPQEGPIRRLLLAVDDPRWHGASEQEVREAVRAGADGSWIPDVVVLVTDGTAADPVLRPLLAFDTGDHGAAFRIAPRQTAAFYLVLHLLSLDLAVQDFEERSPADPWDDEDDEEMTDEDLPHPAGFYLEAPDPAPRYESPARPLPPIPQEGWGLLVRTDFGDDAAWAALVAHIHHPGNVLNSAGEEEEDFVDFFQIVDDPVFEGATPQQLMALVHADGDSDEMASGVLLIADREALAEPRGDLLAVPLDDHFGLTFRLASGQAGNLSVNLAIANQDLEDYMGRELADSLLEDWWRRAMRGSVPAPPPPAPTRGGAPPPPPPPAVFRPPVVGEGCVRPRRPGPRRGRRPGPSGSRPRRGRSRRPAARRPWPAR